METDVHEPRFFTQNASRLPQEPFEVIHICVRERRENGVEGSVGKGKLARVGLDEFDFVAEALPRDAKLILRDVDARHRPAKLDQRRDVESGAAAKVEAAAASS